VSTKKVKKVFCGFEQTINYFKKTTNEDIKFILSGNPIEKKISDISLKTFDNLADENDLSLKILVLGGSQGSKKLNELIPSISNDLGDILITHQTGKGNLSNTKELYEKENFLNFEILEFIEDMSKVYEWADVVISRSGALSVTEIMGSASVGIFVPLPWAIDNHQLYNAKQLTDRKAAFIIEESDTMNEDFICLFKNIRKQKLENKFNLIKNNSLNCFIKQSEKIIFQEITN
jgi:UDP-N-acetylglucosamine--N-acetylmuramyl-(pentapeptide) pyrophosphoryl-undecaprenol N-acetylglucosamine transferase